MRLIFFEKNSEEIEFFYENKNSPENLLKGYRRIILPSTHKMTALDLDNSKTGPMALIGLNFHLHEFFHKEY